MFLKKKIMGLEGLLSWLCILWSTKRKNGFGVNSVNLYKTYKLWGRSLLFFIFRVSKYPVEGNKVSKTSGSDIPSFFSCFWTIKHFDLSLITFPLPSLGHLITKGKVAHWNLGNSPSNMGSATEFRQFNFNYRLGYITYVRLYHHAGNDIH